MNIQFAPNTLYYGDCLEIIADFPDNSIDLSRLLDAEFPSLCPETKEAGYV